MSEYIYGVSYDEEWTGIILQTGGNGLFSGYLIKYNNILKKCELYEFITHGMLRPMTLKQLDGYTIFCNEDERDEIIVARECSEENYFPYELEDFWECRMEMAPREIRSIIKRKDGGFNKVYKKTKWQPITETP